MAFRSILTVFHGNSNNRALLLILGVIMIWAHATWFVLWNKSGFLDDAYIYLHMANNVLETGTARFFPLSESWALLASSPLHLLILVPAVFLSRLMVDPRSVESARLAFLLSGPLTGFLFLPFFRKRLRLWGLGLFGSGVLAVCTQSALQMEGLLLFWIVLILACYQGSTWDEKPGQYGILLGMLFLTRPEFGLPALGFGTAWVLGTRDGQRIRLWVVGLFLVFLAWVVVSLMLRVYPIPTSYISKLITGRLELFGPSSGSRLPAEVGIFFLGGTQHAPALVWAVPGLTLAAIASGSLRHRLIGLQLLLVCLIFLRAGGHYLWYFENVFIGLVALIIGWLLSKGRQPHWNPGHRIAAAWLVFVLILVAVVNWNETERLSNWSLRSDSSIAFGYRNIGQAYVGQGLFEFPGTDPSYLVMKEIGVVSYFGGPDVWLFDGGGLAQPGTLEGVREHSLARLYPGSLLVTATEELVRINSRFGRTYSWPPVWQAWAFPDGVEGPQNCTIYLPEKVICLKRVTIRGPNQP